MPTIPVAVQMYTLRDETAKDFIGTLKKVAEIGYAGVEFAGFGGLSAKDVKAVMADLGLQAAGAHIGIDALENELPSVIDDMLEIGCRYVVCPYMPEDRRPDRQAWVNQAGILNRIGETCAKHGLTLCYHNHDFEFQKFDGENALDILFANSDPRYLQAELDLYWVTRGGEDAVAYVNKYANRLPLLHIKDMANDAEHSFAEFGEGILNWDAIIPAAKQAGTKWFIVEQDICTRPALDCVATSFNNLKARGLA